MLVELAADDTPLGRARLHYFLLNKGPWSRLDHNEPFVAGAPPKPPQAQLLSGRRHQGRGRGVDRRRCRRRARRAPPGSSPPSGAAPTARFTAVPYSLEYQGELARVAALLREAAALTTQPTLKAYLETRAAALLSNDYYESDVAWMELDASIEPTIGPVRGLRGRVVQLQGGVRGVHRRARRRRDAEAGALRRRAAGDREQPADRSEVPQPEARARWRRSASSTRVFSSGDGNRGVQTAAYNLPNDERVVTEKGSKRVMLKNNQEAKFRMVLQPIAKVALPAADAGQRRLRRLLHAHPDARADARPRPAEHHRGRPRPAPCARS